MLNGLDLFSGIGGLSLALEPWVRTVAYCEIDSYARAVLLARMHEGRLERAPIHDDVRQLRSEHILLPIDIIFGGFPCQDISLAGKRAGLDGERSGLYREVVRLVSELGPRFVFLENVAAIRGHAWRVVEDLARLGFDCRWTNLSAAEVGAPHRRDRWWLLAAHPERLKLRVESGRSGGQDRKDAPELEHDGDQGILADAIGEGRPRNGLPIQKRKGRHGSADSCADVANTDGVRQLQSSGGEPVIGRRFGDSGSEDLSFYWASEPSICRMAHGISSRVDRLKCLGNAVVPAQAREAFKYLMGF